MVPAGDVLQHRGRPDVGGDGAPAAGASPRTRMCSSVSSAEPEDHVYADQVIDESLRRYPLFGIAHRITTDEIVVAERRRCPRDRCSASTTRSSTPPASASRGLRPRSVAEPGPARGEPHPVRGHGEPALSGTRSRSAHHAGGRARGLRRFELHSSATAHPLPSQPRAVPAGDVGTAMTSLGGVPPCWRSCASATGGRTCGAAWSSSFSAHTWWSTLAGNASPSGTSSRKYVSMAGRRWALTSSGREDCMKVIGVGVGRTGTLSLKAALERLGFGPCFHMRNVLDHPERLPLWEAAAAGRRSTGTRFSPATSQVSTGRARRSGAS